MRYSVISDLVIKMAMNYSIIAYCFCVYLVLKVNGAPKDENLELRKKCTVENGLPEDGLTISGSNSFINNPKSHCYLECFLKNIDVIKEDNSMDAGHAISLIDAEIREQAAPVITKCAAKADKIDDRCEKSFEATKCLYEEAPEVFKQIGIVEAPTS